MNIQQFQFCSEHHATLGYESYLVDFYRHHVIAINLLSHVKTFVKMLEMHVLLC